MLSIFIVQGGLPIKDQFGLFLSISGGTALVLVFISWVYYIAHKNKKLCYLIAHFASIFQTFLLLWSFAMLFQYQHLPSLSEAEFLFAYQKYSLTMAFERVGVIGCVVLILCYLLFLFMWLQKDEEWLNKFQKKKKHWAAYLLVLVSINLVFNSHNTQAIEMHFVQLLSAFLDESFDRKSEVDVFTLNRLHLPLINKVDSDARAKPNILFFRMEEISRDSYGLYAGEEHPTTPFVDDLQRRSPQSFFKYDNHVSNSGATDTSTTLIYTGLKSNRKGREFGHFPLMWDYATSAGYQTFMVLPFRISWGRLNEKWAYMPGSLSLDYFSNAENAGKKIAYDESITDSDVADISINWLLNRNKSQPFFGIINFKLPHSNGEGVKTLGYDNLNCPTEPRRLTDYECSIFVLDREMGRVITALEEQGLLDDTIIIASPDHGADQNKHNKGRIYNYYQEVLAIPLFIRFPEKFHTIADSINTDWKNNTSKTTQSIDILPTIVDLLGISTHPLIRNLLQDLDGQSLFSDLPDSRWVFSMNSNALRPWKPAGFGITIGDQYKYIYFEGIEELYDLIADSAEMNNLLLEKNGSIERLHQKIMKFISENHNARELYAYRFPEAITYNQYFSHTILGKDMPTKIGEKKEFSNSIFSTNTKGVLTHGVGVTLDEGFYEFKTSYSFKVNNGQEVSSSYVLGYLENEQWLTLKKGVYPTGNNKTLSILISISPKHKNKDIFLATEYAGEGSLEIHQLEIFKLNGT